MIRIVERCMIVINKEKAEEIKKSEASGVLYNLLLAYAGKVKMNSILERCLLKTFENAKQIPLDVIFSRYKLKQGQKPGNVLKNLEKAQRA